MSRIEVVVLPSHRLQENFLGKCAVEYGQPYQFLIFERDAKFNVEVVATVKDNGMLPIRTAFRSPWRNGIAERWVGSVRRELLDHVIVLNQSHLRRLLREYVRYYHEDRTHLGLGKDTPCGRTVAAPGGNKVIDRRAGWVGLSS